MFFTKKSTKELVRGQPEEKTEKPVKRWKIGKSGQKMEKKERSPDGRTPIFRTKLFWGVVSIVLGLSIAFVGIPMLQTAVSKTQQTVCFAQDVKAGTKITEELLTTTDMSQYHLPGDAVHDPQSVIGQYVKTDAVEGDLVTAARLSRTYPGPNPQLAGLPEGMAAISIALPDMAQSVSGKLREGDIIQLYAVEDNSSFKAVAPPELQYVEVLAASYADGSDVQDAEPAEGESTDTDTLATVTLLANEEQAACLAGLNQNAKLHAALVVRGDDAAKATALETQAEYFAALEVPDDAAGAETNIAPGTLAGGEQNG